jgi:magnesium chelatase family protein
MDDQDIKAAVEHAAAERQALWIEAPAGAGATIMARYYHSLQPELTGSAAARMGKTYARAGLELPPWANRVPFRVPHFTASIAGLVGTKSGGVSAAWGRPGELQLAAFGVLYLADVPEFRRAGLVALGQHLAALEAEARPLVVASALPCPCGQLACSCDAAARARFAERSEILKGLLPLGWATVRIDRRLADLGVVREMLRHRAAQIGVAP